ncbi:MAG: sigma-54-dependent Fis family transcriptional regulator, partial [Deltaproteobacteria bacterium]|nr:sigma-54-dependent Fis family transcriptional regulator [Deltaproteobacteria bacterium]
MKTKQTAPHILVVDDELSMREFLEIMLNRKGYRVSLAKNGKQALSLLGKNIFDLIICDIKLGDISGLEVLKKAKKENPAAIVIMISAYASTETAVEAMNAGAYDYVPKPFDTDEFEQTIENAL